MSKIELQDVASLTNEQTFITAYNLNNQEIETKSNSFLSRDGTAPNTMAAPLDMNSNRILNLPEPNSDLEPVRRREFSSLTADIDSSVEEARQYAESAEISAESAATSATGIYQSLIGTKSDVESIDIPSDVDGFRTTGYASAGDGGQGLYKRVNTEPTHTGKVQSNDGAWWELSETQPNILQFGADRFGNTDCTICFQNLYEYSSSKGFDIGFIPAGSYITSGRILTITGPRGFKLYGEGGTASRIYSHFENPDYLISFEQSDPNKVEVTGLLFWVPTGVAANSSGTIALHIDSAGQVDIHHNLFYGFNNHIKYVNTFASRTYNNRFQGCYTESVIYAGHSANGSTLTDNWFFECGKDETSPAVLVGPAVGGTFATAFSSSGNDFEVCLGGGILYSGLCGGTSTGDYFEQCGVWPFYFGTGLNQGFSAQGCYYQSADPVTLSNIDGLKITDCVFDGFDIGCDGSVSNTEFTETNRFENGGSLTAPTSDKDSSYIFNASGLRSRKSETAYISYTPTVSSFGGSVTYTVNSCKYRIDGKEITIKFDITNTSGGSGYVTITPPSGISLVANSGAAGGVDLATGANICFLPTGSSEIKIWYYNGNYPGPNTRLVGTLICEQV